MDNFTKAALASLLTVTMATGLEASNSTSETKEASFYLAGGGCSGGAPGRPGGACSSYRNNDRYDISENDESRLHNDYSTQPTRTNEANNQQQHRRDNNNYNHRNTNNRDNNTASTNNSSNNWETNRENAPAMRTSSYNSQKNTQNNRRQNSNQWDNQTAFEDTTKSDSMTPNSTADQNQVRNTTPDNLSTNMSKPNTTMYKKSATAPNTTAMPGTDSGSAANLNSNK